MERNRRSCSEPAAAGERREPLPALVGRAQRGDAEALDTLVLRFQDMASGYAAALLGELQGAEDVAQEAFVEALRRLPDLKIPAAFPSLLQALVRKHADRLTRRRRFPTVPLDDAFGVVSGAADPAAVLQEGAQRAYLRQAVGDLPAPERAVVLLFYLGDQSLPQIAATLGVPLTTLKSRLYEARQRLKRRMLAMTEEKLKDQRPSRDDTFRERVKTRHASGGVYRIFQAPDGTPLPPRDWEALERECAAIEERSEAGEALDFATALQGAQLLLLDFGDQAGAAALLTRYLSQPGLSPSERAGADYFRLMALGLAASRGEFVRLHRAFLEWVRTRLPVGDIHINRESSPVAPDAPDRLPDEALLLWAFTPFGSENAWCNVGRLDEWLLMAREILAQTPKRLSTREGRGGLLRLMVRLLSLAGRQAEALSVIDDMQRLADEPDSDWRSPRWRFLAAECRVDRSAGGREAIEKVLEAAAAWEAALDPANPEHAGERAGAFGTCARLLSEAGQFERATGYFRLLLESGRAEHLDFFGAATALWKARGERARGEVLALLRAAADRPEWRPGEAWSYFGRQEAFAAVRDDPEFTDALRR